MRTETGSKRTDYTRQTEGRSSLFNQEHYAQNNNHKHNHHNHNHNHYIIILHHYITSLHTLANKALKINYVEELHGFQLIEFGILYIVNVNFDVFFCGTESVWRALQVYGHLLLHPYYV